MKMRNTGKVHPFSSSSASSDGGYSSVLNILPAVILSLISVLSLQDREVLAYMLTRSLKSTNPNSEDKKKTHGHRHNSPALFDCDCFHCYTSFWFRWDSSPHRELIHQAIEAFEDHLNNGDHRLQKAAGKSKRKDKQLARARKLEIAGGVRESPENLDSSVVATPVGELVEGEREAEDGVDSPPAAVVRSCQKGLARKVLPDVMGIFSLRLWNLWNPGM